MTPERSVSPNRAWLPGVDQMRALLALLVLFYHGYLLFSARLIEHADFVVADWPRTRNPLLAVIAEGHTAVAGFMVLSGFIFVQGTAGHEVRYGAFLRNRLLRIYPMYLLVAVFALSATQGSFSLSRLVLLVLPLANYTVPVGVLSAMAWTVGVEFQFYLVFPLLLRLTEAEGEGWLIRAILLALLLRLFAVLAGADAQWMSYWTIAGRIDQFLLGMLAGLRFARRPPGGGWPPLVIAGTALWALLYLFHLAGGWPLHVWWKAVWPDAEALGWAGVILSWQGIAGRLPAPVARGLEGIGRISFSIYLLHFAVIWTLGAHGWLLRPFASAGADALLTTALLALPLVLGLSAFTYATVERPFMALRRRYVAG
jgi:peptidoglycan/LPS O-acetylase OafA/YrhL